MEFIRKKNSVGKVGSKNMERKDELQVPVEKLEHFALTLNYLVERGHKRVVSSLLLGHLLVDVVSQVSNSRDIIIHFIELGRNEQHSHLVEDHGSRVHKLYFEGFCGHLLAQGQVVLVDHLYGDVDGLSGLAEFDAHFVDTVDYTFTPLHTRKRSQSRHIQHKSKIFYPQGV